ncbi:MAG: 3-hydroxyacyl-CoA dehydrogenase/enoyl-CoA hydratase family protein, partial [Candidatus Sericytochromatia bacterium]|nr:3-hydroxyacyl-CoA dehydrogenase/enoyl-CoA hydratase family protein [Candidatus Sericytochromatia bacterium]
AGVMGAGIAAHLASAGIPVTLLDILPPGGLADEDRAKGLTEQSPQWRNKFANTGIERALTAKPTSLFYSKRDAKLVTAGNTVDNLDLIGAADWVIEVVPEVLSIKKATYDMLEKHAKDTAIITSNTSGIAIAEMMAGRPEAFRKRFFVTHFFNPVRHMKLLEFVVGPDTDTATVAALAEFGETTLGKGIVYGKDTPNFVANRIGVFAMMAAMHHMDAEGLTFDQVDKILGPSTGRPKSATFRTADIVGLDTMVHVAKNVYDHCTTDEKRDTFIVPAYLPQMVERKLLGQKSGAGFFKMDKSPDGKKAIHRLDTTTFEYVPTDKVRFDSLGESREFDEVGERTKFIVNYDDAAGRYAWAVLRDMIVYSANRLGEIADDIVNVDRAMKWGFNWEQGPFETWDSLGVAETAARIEKEGIPVPKAVQALLAAGLSSFYKFDGADTLYFDLATKAYKPVPQSARIIDLAALKRAGKTVAENDGASLIDLGDGVLCLEFHTKMNTLDGDIVAMINQAVEIIPAKGYKGLVLSNQGEHFSAGANLGLVVMSIFSEAWDEIDMMARELQDAIQKLRFAPFPVVAAPFGLALGGGTEISLGCDRVVAHGELYMGLVEVGVGVVPGGGGCKETLRRFFMAQQANTAKMDKAGLYAIWEPDRSKIGGPMQVLQKAFEQIGMAKVSTSFREAQESGLLSRTDRLVMNRDHLTAEAKAEVLKMAEGYTAPEPFTFRLPGIGAFTAFQSALADMEIKGQLLPHDKVVATQLAKVLTGGDTNYAVTLTEQQVLDLEREAFLNLCKTELTLARIQHMLQTGKPLRN